MSQLSRGTLHIADEPEIQEENITSSDDGEESDPNYHESCDRTAQIKPA